MADRAEALLNELNPEARVIAERMHAHIMATYIRVGLSQQDVVNNLHALGYIAAVTLANTTETKSLYNAFCLNISHSILKMRGERW